MSEGSILDSIPMWEIVIVGFAIIAMLIVLILWYFFGYDLVVVPTKAAVMNP